MTLKDATRRFGSVGLLFPLILIISAANSAFACPGHKNGVAYRTGAINTKTVSFLEPTIITYGGPASYGRCPETRGAKYVRSSNGARYIAVSNSAPRTKYVAVRSMNYDDYAPRYVVRNFDYDDAPRYVAVRNYAPRTKYVAVRNIDYDDDEPRYVAVRKDAPITRYVAVRNIDYDDDVPSLDQVGTVSARHIVVKSDYLAGTQEVIYPNMKAIDNSAYVAPSIDDVDSQGAAYTNAAFTAGSGESYNGASDMESTYPDVGSTGTMSNDDIQAILDEGGVVDPAVIENAHLSPVAVDTGYPDVMSTGAMSNDDVQAILDEGGVIDPAIIEDAYLSPVAIDTSPNIVNTSAVNYVPSDYVDNGVSVIGSDPMYIETDAVRFVRVNDNIDDTIVDADTTFVAVNEEDDTCLCPDALRMSNDEVGTSTVSYIPVDDVEALDAENVIYVLVDDVDVQTVSYVPAESIDARYIVDDDCPMSLSNVDADLSYDSYY